MRFFRYTPAETILKHFCGLSYYVYMSQVTWVQKPEALTTSGRS